MSRLAVGAGAIVLTGVLGVSVLAATVFPASSNADATFETAPVSCSLPGDATTADGLTAEQTSNAAIIVSTGRALNVPEKGLVVAIATAMQESTLRNITFGHLDSVGLFQQRAPWGTFEERTDPATSTTLFFTGGRGGQPGLLDIAGWEDMPIAVAAQSVQASAFPSAYAKWETLAVELVGGVACQGDPDAPLAGNTLGEKAVSAAARYLGTPYSWGGGSWEGPTVGVAQGAGTVGFDCSGLTLYAWAQATGGKVHLDHFTGSQWNATQRVPIAQLEPGDLVFYGSSGESSHHMGMYVGGGRMIEAPRTGLTVRYSTIYRGDLLPYGGRVVVPGNPA